MVSIISPQAIRRPDERTILLRMKKIADSAPRNADFLHATCPKLFSSSSQFSSSTAAPNVAQKFAFSEEIKSLFLGDFFMKTSLWSKLMKEFMGFTQTQRRC